MLFVTVLSSGSAAYLKNVPQQITQPDGTVIHCFASGDEFHNWLHDSAGFTIVQDALGFYVYAVLAGEELVSSEYIVGRDNPIAAGLQPEVNISPQAWRAKREEFEANIPEIPVRKAGNNKGKINNIVIFITFSDDTIFSKRFDHMETMFNDSSSSSANSMYNFFKLASYEQLYINSHFYPIPSGDTILSYRDINPRSYYLPYSENNNPNGFTNDRTSREHDLLERAVLSVASSIPPTLDIDYDRDGNVDNVCFMITGNAVAGGGILWPHRWSLYTRDVRINGERVYDYNLNLANANGNNTCAGVITHEMMHTLSAPDLYRYDDRSINPVGSWDLMSSTNYTTPQGLGAYMKWKYGKWINSIPEITEPGTYTLYSTNGTSPSKIAYKIYPDPFYYSSEYLVLEYRNTASSIFENNLPGSGLLIYRINDKYHGNANANGQNILDEVYLFRPDGKTTVDGSVDQAHFSANVNRKAFNGSTNPYPFFSSGYGMESILITNITTAGDSIQFTVGIPEGFSFVPKEVLTVGCKEARNHFKIKSNVGWTITKANDCSWLTIPDRKLTGWGNDSIPFMASTNTDETYKTCTLYVTQQSFVSKRDTLVIVQPCGVSIKEITQSAKIKVFPNPTNNQLRIMIPDSPTCDIRLFDVVGRQVSVVEQLKIGNQKSEVVIDVSHLPAGIYVLKITTEDKRTYNEKIAIY